MVAGVGVEVPVGGEHGDSVVGGGVDETFGRGRLSTTLVILFYKSLSFIYLLVIFWFLGVCLVGMVNASVVVSVFD